MNKKLIFRSLKWLLIAYLASQAFFEIDLLSVMIGALLNRPFDSPLGLNLTNLILFGLVAVYIVRKEYGRSKQIRYTFTAETSRLLSAPSDAPAEEQKARDLCAAFQRTFEEEMDALSQMRFPATMPLRLEDILTTDGFVFEESDEEDSVLQYVEELSPLEVATNALFNWLRNEALYKHFTLELQFKDEDRFVRVNSGNPATDSYIRRCPEERDIEVLARDAARRVYFEAESRLCRDFDVFKTFYAIVSLINQAQQAESEDARAAIEMRIQTKLDEALAAEPEFLTLELLQGIIWFRRPDKSSASMDKAEALFNDIIKQAESYYRKGKEAGRSAEATTIDRKVYNYVTGLSTLFLARIECQSSHRFGAFDEDPSRYADTQKERVALVEKAVKLLSKASRPHGKRFPLAFRIEAFARHCHDFFDKEEIFYKNPSREAPPPKLSDSGRDLQAAVKIYSKGIELCDRISDEVPEFALHHKDAIVNQRGFAELYFCLIEAKRRRIGLDALSEFVMAEQDLLWSFVCGTDRKAYALANLSILYSMSGQFDLAAKAGVCGQFNDIKEIVSDTWVGNRPDLEIKGPPDDRTVATLQATLEESWEKTGHGLPSLEKPFHESWDYPEGINELSYSFVFKGLTRLLEDSDPGEGAEALAIGLRLHQRSLEVLCRMDLEDDQISGRAKSRFRNFITNFKRAFWHFDDRTALVQRTDQPLDQIHEALGRKVPELSARIQELSADTASDCIQSWMQSVQESIEIPYESKLELPRTAN